jgi:hypothetical protein
MGWGRTTLLFLKIAVGLMLGTGASFAFAQGDPPGRVARLNYSEGAVAFAPSGEVEWSDADVNRPLVPGDKLWTDKGVRAEIQVGSATVRMEGRTQLEVLALDDRTAQLSVTQGTVQVRVRTLPDGDNFEIDTPNLAYRAAYPGDGRIAVEAPRGVTRVTVLSGTGAVYGDTGQALTMAGGQRITFKGRALAQLNVQEQPPEDNFDRWAAERNRREDQSVAARYVPRDVVGYALLDASGEWRQDANYGAVWFPQGTDRDWAPFRSGRWEWIAPWGWTWLDEAPWAFATSHYGRWALIGPRWAWVPGRLGVRPTYAPALVAFAGNGNSPFAVGGKPAIAWFPLAPGEAWQPEYPATTAYVDSVNANMPPPKLGAYAYQRKPQAVTAMAVDDFHRGRPSKGGATRIAARALATAQVVAPPAMPLRETTTVARAAPPQQKKPEAPLQAQREPGRAEQHKVAPQRVAKRRAEPAKVAKAAKPRRETLARREHARRVEQARRAADRDAQLLAAQRAQREAWQRQQEALAQQFRREQLLYEEQLQQRRQQQRGGQRGIPILGSGRIS